MLKRIDTKKFLTEEECSDIIKMAEEEGITLKDDYGGEPVYSLKFKPDHPFYKDMKKRIEVFNEYFGEEELVLNTLSINKYSKTTKRDMPVHNDIIDFSISTPLNNDYSGGGLYFPFYRKLYNSKTQKIGESIIWKADRFFSFHEVLPIEEGSRYVLIMFFSKPNVTERSIGKFLLFQLTGLFLIKVLPVYKILKYFKIKR